MASSQSVRAHILDLGHVLLPFPLTSLRTAPFPTGSRRFGHAFAATCEIAVLAELVRCTRTHHVLYRVVTAIFGITLESSHDVVAQ